MVRKSQLRVKKGMDEAVVGASVRHAVGITCLSMLAQLMGSTSRRMFVRLCGDCWDNVCPPIAVSTVERIVTSLLRGVSRLVMLIGDVRAVSNT